MILSLQTDSFGSRGGIPTYNRLVCRALSDFDATTVGYALVAMDKPEYLEPWTHLHPNLRLTAFGGNRLRFIRSAIQTVIQNPIELLLAGHVNYAPLCSLLRLLRPRMRFGVFVYGWDVWSRLPATRRRALQSADFVISISNFTKQEAIRNNDLRDDRVFVLPNAVERPRNHTLSSRTGSSLPRGTKLLSVGRLDATERQKGFDTVIELLPKIVESVPDVQYLIVGAGTDLERHQQLARTVGVSDRVHFLGTVEDDMLHCCYESCDLFVMPSNQEGFGFVYLEAMDYSKAVVAAASGGVPEVVEDGVTGVLVNYGDKEKLADALIDLCCDPNKRERLGSAGYQRLQSNFTYEHFRRKLHEIILKELPVKDVPANRSSAGVTRNAT